MIFVTLIDSLSVSGGLGIPPNFKAALNSRLVDWVVYCPTIHRLKPIVIVNLFVDEVIKIVDDVILSLVSHLLVSVFVCKRSLQLSASLKIMKKLWPWPWPSAQNNEKQPPGRPRGPPRLQHQGLLYLPRGGLLSHLLRWRWSSYKTMLSMIFQKWKNQNIHFGVFQEHSIFVSNASWTKPEFEQLQNFVHWHVVTRNTRICLHSQILLLCFSFDFQKCLEIF